MEADKTDVEVIYCAGPMFSPEEKQAMLEIAASFEAEGFATYVPHRDGLEVARIMKLLRAGRFAASTSSRSAQGSLEEIQRPGDRPGFTPGDQCVAIG